jgi:competence protein ComEC
MKKVINFRLALFVGLSLIGGVLCAYFVALHNFLAMAIVLAIYLGLGLFYFLYKYEKQFASIKLVFIGVFCLFFIIGSLLCALQINSFNKADLHNHYYTVEAKVEEVYQTNTGVYAVVSNVKLKGSAKENTNYKIGVYISNATFDKIDIGKEIRFFGLLKDRALIYEERLSVYNIQNKVKWTCFVDSSEITIIGNSPTLFQTINIFIRDTLYKGLERKEFSLAYALLTGHDEFIDADILQQFRSAGIAHIFAVSGLHIGFVATILSFIFKKTKINKWVSFGITCLILLLYSGVCGFSSSSLRTTVMCAVMLLSRNFGEKYDGISSISIAGIFILLVSPIELFCVGFQLSFSVVLGILILSNPIKRKLKFMPEKLAESIATVLSAQVVSIPICLSAFGQVSLVSVLFNLAFIPVVGIIYVLTFIATIIGGIFSVPSITLFLSNYILKAIIFLIDKLDSSFLLIGRFSLGIFTLFYYGAMYVVSGQLNLTKKVKTITVLALGITFVLGSIFLNVANVKQANSYFIGDKNLCACVVVYNGESSLLINDASIYMSTSKLKAIKTRTGITKIDNLVIGNSQKTVDIQNVLTKVNSVFNVKNLYYYGQEKKEQELAINKSFKKVNVENFENGEKLPIKNFYCAFSINGYGIEYKIKNSWVLTLSSFENSPQFTESSKKYDTVVAVDYLERVFAHFNAKNSISYLSTSSYQNAQDNGTLRVAFD